MSKGQLSKESLNRMHDVLARYVEDGVVPGLVSAVSRRGETHIEVMGSKELGGAVPMHRDTIFRISSMSKPITAVAAMILVEECVLRLDDPVDGFLPELAGRRVLKRLDGPLDETVPANRPITLRDLLTFRLGFGMLMAPDTYPIVRAAAERGLAAGPPRMATLPEPNEWLRGFGELPLMHQPGESWMYHIGSAVLGILIARACGRPLEDFLRERVFAPLGMKDTGFSVPPKSRDRLATSYAVDPGSRSLVLYDGVENSRWAEPPAFPDGGADLVSTVDDYLAFARMMLGKGAYAGARILSRPSVEVMTMDHLTQEQKARSALVPGEWDARGWGFGVGVRTEREGLACAGRYGWDGGMGTTWFADPTEELTGILLTQRMWESPQAPSIAVDFETLAYQAIDG
ncbi:serine hydrolase domain-containing protein [Streptomyces sp. NPDC004647]|uniref:serine hydrolase domain-containing protein n=1 Tax=Streptomyces sp. NPDC004647 TaxID=3154671 RepID=UPI0033ADB203